MEFSQLNSRQIATILASLRLFQREAKQMNMVEAFPEHFQDGSIEPLSTEEIDFLCESINVGIEDTALRDGFRESTLRNGFEKSTLCDGFKKPTLRDGFEKSTYITREFVRHDCGIHGAELSDEDCDVIIAEVRLLVEQGKFNHSGVYWIANRLAAEGRIHPILPA